LLAEIEERKRLERQILNISEREQRRIGQELHDSLGQQLTGIAFMTKVLERRLTDKSSIEAADVAEIGKLVNQATEQARGLAKGLHPVDLDTGTLLSALEELAATTESLFGVRCLFKRGKPVPADNAASGVHLYRIAQEAVTNAVKHGRAKNIQIELAPKGDTCVLIVTSDGLDFPEDPGDRNTGMGLQIMAHRADIIGGSLDIRKGAAGGTVVTCTFPNSKRE
jgi:signal transduction histidine kinase